MTERNGHPGRTPLHIVLLDELSAPVLITGGAGFIGCNLAERLLASGIPVIILDNLARPGVERNAAWLRERFGRELDIVVADVCDAAAVGAAVARVRTVFHFAAQAAVTTSVADPADDFETNVRGTLNVLEAARRRPQPPRVIFTSTNKVYGTLSDLDLRVSAGRYEPVRAHVRAHGISESRQLDFRTPYGCSKGAADQYVLDYAHTYALDTVVLRMSCIYGVRQRGTEDQGWVAHFMNRALHGEPITMYGDGLQVRDVLYIDDLLDALMLTHSAGALVRGRAFNVGGGPDNAVSLLEVVDAIGALHGRRPLVRFEPWRPGDQRYYVSDVRRFRSATGWRPRVSPAAGLARLYDWLVAEHAASPPLRRMAAERG
jgi:CDP-paratose 2-epimerase